MTVIGITGGTGCGKTTALLAARELGALTLDCDEIYHRLLETSEPLLTSIGEAFPGVVREGRLQRKELGRRVFGDPEGLKKLNALTHPAVKEEVLRLLREQKPRLAVIDAIGLFEGSLASLCGVTIAVTAPRELRIRRLMAREGITAEYAAARIDAQRSNESFSALCTYTLSNEGDQAAFQKACRSLFETILNPKENPQMSEKNIREELLLQPKNGYESLSAEDRQSMEAYCRRYAAFMDAAKTEREAVSWAVREAEARGFRPLTAAMALKPGDKVYRNNRDKSILLAVIGRRSMAEGVNICASHIDSPRMDVKPNPLYEEAEIAYFKTHYYGGIKKYQWTTVPLAIHGVVSLLDGSVLTVTIGEEAGDPVFCVSDLLIHLAQDQMKKPMATGIEGEQLNVILGTEPLAGDEGAGRVKLNILRLLNEKYGLREEDFLSAELTVVPAGKCREVGLDRSLLGAYGHDDRVCAYASLEPLLSLDVPEKTAVCILADKEEIGSVGVSGMQSAAFECFMEDLCGTQGVRLSHCFQNSFCLSADVSNAYDPSFGPRFGEVHDKQNNSLLNHGVGVCKYTGSKGKGGASDASAEAMGYVRRLFAANKVIWQTATLGKVDQGGGGTVAAYMANRNIVTVDAGTPVLSMHAPWELVSKLDCYMTMKAMAAVYAGLEE